FYAGLSILSGSNRNWIKEAGPRYDNSAVFAVIQFLTRQVTSEPRFIVERQRANNGKTEWVEDIQHELPKILRRGPIMTSDQLIGGAILSLVVNGNAYWVKDRLISGKLTGFVYVSHWRMEAVRDRNSPFGDRFADGTNLVTFYEYTNPDGNKIPFRVEDIVHFRWPVPDPVRPEYGLSPIFAALREIVTDNEAATLSAALLKNAGIPGVAMSPKEGSSIAMLSDPDQRKDLNTKFARRISGDMAGAPFIAPGPMEFTVIGFSPDKLVLKDTRSLAVTRIFSPFGIDPMVCGFPSEQKTYSNFEEALRHAWRSGSRPVCRLIAETIHEQVLAVDYPQDAETARAYWDLSEVPEEQDDKYKVADMVRKDWMADGITRAEFRLSRGFDVEESRDKVFYSEVKAANAPKPADNSVVQKALAARAKRAIPVLQSIEIEG
ncbi:MAG: phage portal protein, partial [Desulfurellales bacterium]